MEEGIRRVTPTTRRRYSAAFKAQVLRECAESGASVAGTALTHGINANLVHKWRRCMGSAQAAGVANMATAGFIPVAVERALRVPPAPDTGAGLRPAEPIQVSVQRGAVRVQVIWPTQAAADFIAWLAELTR